MTPEQLQRFWSSKDEVERWDHIPSDVTVTDDRLLFWFDTTDLKEIIRRAGCTIRALRVQLEDTQKALKEAIGGFETKIGR